MPLRTNEEMVRILRRYNKQNDIEGITDGYLKIRWEVVHKIAGNPPEVQVKPQYGLH